MHTTHTIHTHTTHTHACVSCLTLVHSWWVPQGLSYYLISSFLYFQSFTLLGSFLSSTSLPIPDVCVASWRAKAPCAVISSGKCEKAVARGRARTATPARQMSATRREVDLTSPHSEHERVGVAIGEPEFTRGWLIHIPWPSSGARVDRNKYPTTSFTIFANFFVFHRIYRKIINIYDTKQAHIKI